MRISFRIFTAYLLLLPFTFINLSGTAFALLTDGANAIDGLGQISGGDMVYTTALTGLDNDSFNTSYEVAVDELNDRLFVVDRENNRVLSFEMDGNHTFSGTDRVADNVLGQPNFTTGSIGLTQSKLNVPVDAEYDPTNNRLFVLDALNSRVMVFDVSTITDGENATYVLGQTDFTTSSSGTTQSKFDRPQKLEYDQTTGLLYLADYYNNRIMIFDVSPSKFTDSGSGYNASYLLGQSSWTTSVSGAASQNNLNDPSGLAVDTVYHTLFVADISNNRVIAYDVSSSRLTGSSSGYNASYVLGQTDFTSSSSGLSVSTLNRPADVAYDRENQRLFVSSNVNDRVLVFDVDVISNGEDAVNVLGQVDFDTNGAGTTQSTFSNPNGLEYSNSTSKLFVAETANHRVTVFDAADPTPIPEFSTVMLFVVIFVLGFAVFQKNAGLRECRA